MIPGLVAQVGGTTTTGNGTTTTDSATQEGVRLVEQLLPEGIPGWLIEYGMAVLVLVIGLYGSKLAIRLFGRTIARRIQRPSITQTVLRSVRLAIMLVAVGIALAIVGFRGSDILLSVGVFSAVLGIVLAPIVGSIINGVFVLADQPYEIGDMIEISDTNTRGFVEDITIRYTKIFTLDNTFIVISNSSIRDRDVVNYSAEDERTRLSLKLTVTYEGDLDEARNLMETAARRVDEVITGGPDIRIGSARYPAAPTCYIEEYADHGVQLVLRYWAKEPYKLMTVRSKVNERVWAQLEDADVHIPYPHSHVVFDETSGSLPVEMQREGQPTGRAGQAPEEREE
ncbi:mechanosensitive ion channel family protein [Haloarchaeobius sp. FL176]|uniref:mechanosensitive ion channel family protein n=1 Tax=Haloarchaeobius sp. FL176 TaxID=2967129 RepID=UPI0021493164|nr:mechanosensitive ion channel family protein [Haloarchaeobius sp. FL176]